MTIFQQRLYLAADEAVKGGSDGAELVALVKTPEFSWDDKLWSDRNGPASLMRHIYTYQKWSEVNLVRQLLELGADINEMDITGVPLWYNTLLCPDKLALYLDRGVDVNEAFLSFSGIPFATPLVKAAAGSITPGADSATCIRMLVEHGARIDHQDCASKTALHHAINLGQFSMAAVLLECGANASVGDNRGRSALDLLRDKYRQHTGFAKMEELLESHIQQRQMRQSTRRIATSRPKVRL